MNTEYQEAEKITQRISSNNKTNNAKKQKNLINAYNPFKTNWKFKILFTAIATIVSILNNKEKTSHHIASFIIYILIL